MEWLTLLVVAPAVVGGVLAAVAAVGRGLALLAEPRAAALYRASYILTALSVAAFVVRGFIAGGA